jgi:hypothetical protein
MLLPPKKVLPGTEGKVMQVKKVRFFIFAMFRSVFAHIASILLLL